jgi:hypothetical protein
MYVYQQDKTLRLTGNWYDVYYNIIDYFYVVTKCNDGYNGYEEFDIENGKKRLYFKAVDCNVIDVYTSSFDTELRITKRRFIYDNTWKESFKKGDIELPIKTTTTKSANFYQDK